VVNAEFNGDKALRDGVIHGYFLIIHRYSCPEEAESPLYYLGFGIKRAELENNHCCATFSPLSQECSNHGAIP